MDATSVLSGDSTSSSPAFGCKRRLVVTWQHPVERSISPVGILAFDGSTGYSFYYIENVRSVVDFRPFLGFADLEITYESEQLFPLFSQRAMAPRRPDYSRWVTKLGLEDDATPWEQIARSGGVREGDTIQLFPVPLVDNGILTCSFLVHGIRHIFDHALTIGDVQRTISREELDAQLRALRPGDQLLLADQRDNAFNVDAILTTTTNLFPLGWVPNLLVEDLHRLEDRQRIDVRVQQVNSPDAGWHLRLLAQITASVPLNFEVFSGDQWAPYRASS
jgi:hypothetical protein